MSTLSLSSPDFEERRSRSEADRRFPVTRWSLVLGIQGNDETKAAEAFEELCSIYWVPLFWFVVGKGRTKEDAKDITQAFFWKLLRQEPLRNIEVGRGRLRAYLRTAMGNFLIDDWRSRSTSGDPVDPPPFPFGWDKVGGEAGQVPLDTRSPDELLDEHWAYTVLELGLQKLGAYYAGKNRASFFEDIRGHISWNEQAGDYDRIAARHGMTNGAVRQAVLEMRRRYRSYLEVVICDTVGTEEDAKDEIAHLVRILAGRR